MTYVSAIEKRNSVFDYLKGLIISILITFALVILFAFSIKWFSLEDKLISPINLLVKLISVVIGSTIAIKGSSRGLAKGAIFGILYIVVAFLTFSGLANTFSVDLSLFLDTIFCAIAGGIVGIIKVNKK